MKRWINSHYSHFSFYENYVIDKRAFRISRIIMHMCMLFSLLVVLCIVQVVIMLLTAHWLHLLYKSWEVYVWCVVAYILLGPMLANAMEELSYSWNDKAIGRKR